jgi:hypothetical protein
VEQRKGERGEGGDPVQESEMLRVTGRIPAAVKFSSHRSRCIRTDTDRNSSREREKDARMLSSRIEESPLERPDFQDGTSA